MDHSARFQSIFKREIKREGADKLLDFLFSKASDRQHHLPRLLYRRPDRTQPERL